MRKPLRRHVAQAPAILGLSTLEAAVGSVGPHTGIITTGPIVRIRPLARTLRDASLVRRPACTPAPANVLEASARTLTFRGRHARACCRVRRRVDPALSVELFISAAAATRNGARCEAPRRTSGGFPYSESAYLCRS